jgi:hypothetical protein
MTLVLCSDSLRGAAVEHTPREVNVKRLTKPRSASRTPTGRIFSVEPEWACHPGGSSMVMGSRLQLSTSQRTGYFARSLMHAR